MASVTKLWCECGQRKVDGKCPVCDVKLAKPHQKRISTESKISERERSSNHLSPKRKRA